MTLVRCEEVKHYDADDKGRAIIRAHLVQSPDGPEDAEDASFVEAKFTEPADAYPREPVAIFLFRGSAAPVAVASRYEVFELPTGSTLFLFIVPKFDGDAARIVGKLLTFDEV